MVSSIGIPFGLIKYISTWEKDNRWDEIRLIFKQVNTLLFLVGISVLIINILFANQIAIFLFGSDEYSGYLILISVSIPLVLINQVYESILKGLKKFNHFVNISIAISVFSLIIVVIFVYNYGLEGAVYGILVSSFLITVVYCYYFHKYKLVRIKDYFSFNFNYSNNFKSVLKLGIASLIIGFADQASQIIIRSLVIRSLGIDANGLYQSIYAISLNYFNILFLSLGVYLLPILSELKDKDKINIEINSILKLTFIVICPLLLTLFTFREQIIFLLYSKEFSSAEDLLYFNILGDYFKAFSWIIGAWLVPLSKVKEWVAFSLIYYIGFLILTVVLLEYYHLGLKSIVISYFISYVLHSAINVYYIIRFNDFKFSKINLKLLLVSFIFILFGMTVSDHNQLYGYILLTPLVVIWLKISITVEEFKKLIQIIRMKLL